MQIAAADTDFGEIFGQIFGHSLRQSRDQHALTFLRADANLLEEVVDLALYRANFHFGIDEAGGANDLLDDHAAGPSEFVRTGGRGNVDDLIHAVFEFFESERAIVERRRHAETVIHQRLLARA